MIDLKLAPKSRLVEVNTNGMGSTTVKILVGTIDLMNRSIDEARMKALEAALIQCGNISFSQEIEYIDGMSNGWTVAKHPSHLLFHVTYNADIHSAVMAAIAPFDDMWD